MNSDRYLLDTHILIWAMEKNNRLPGKITQLLKNPHNNIIVSVATVWEIIIKKSKKKIKISKNIEADIKIAGLQLLPIVISHVMKIETLPLYHQDPFDRILIAQSIVENLTLITSDDKIWRYKLNILKV